MSAATDTCARQVGRNLRLIRKAQRMTLEDLATASGVARASIVAIEGGERGTTLITLVALAEALGVPTRELFAGWPSPVRRPLSRPILAEWDG